MRTWRGDDPECKDKLTDDGYKVYDKAYGHSLTEETVRRGFEEYFQLGQGEKAERGLLIRRVVNRMTSELEALQHVLEHEESRMYSASLLFVYEGDVESLQAAFKSEKAARQAMEQAAEATTPGIPDGQKDGTTDGDLGASQVITGIEPSVLRAIHAANPSPGKPTDTGLNLGDTLPNGTTTPLVLSTTDLSTEDGEEDDDGDGDGDEQPPQKTTVLKLIDFAHAHWTPGQGPDENVLHGIRNVIKMLETFL